MTGRLQLILLLLFALICHLLPCSVLGQESDAQRTIKQATTVFYQSLEQQTGKLQTDRLYRLVNSILITHADFKAMSVWVLGRYWRQATPEQQQRFIAAFRELLIRSYAASVQLVSQDQIHYLPERPSARADRAVVRSEIRKQGDAVVSIDYYLHLTNDKWKVYDLRLEGISLICNYRSSFAAEIARRGLEVLISELEKKNTKKPRDSDDCNE